MRAPGPKLAASRAAERERARKYVEHEILDEAADAWEALSPEERHRFAMEHRQSLRIMSLPAAWLRIRARNSRLS